MNKTNGTTSFDKSDEPAYSPGPYVLSRGADGVDDYWHITSIRPYEKTVASVFFWSDTEKDADLAYANAVLLATSPEMLQALKRLLREIDQIPMKQRTASLKAQCRNAKKVAETAEQKRRLKLIS